MNSQMNDPHEHHPNISSILQGMDPVEAERLREVWDLAGERGGVAFPSDIEVKQALERLIEQTERVNPVVNGRPAYHASTRTHREDRKAREGAALRRPKWIGWAVLAMVAVIGGLSLFTWMRPVTRIAEPGEQLVLTLSDGSRVELNSGSQLRFTRRFRDVRRVHLLGEAFFDIVEEDRPFIVQTFNAQIRVPGTRFGVRAWPGGLEAGTTVALEAGRVILAPEGFPERAVEMLPGQTHRVTRDLDLYDLIDVSIDEATAWRQGDLVFKDQPLGIVLRDVERRFAVEVRMHPARLVDKRLNLALRSPENVEMVVRDLALALGLAYRETPTGFEIFEESVPGPNPQSLR